MGSGFAFQSALCLDGDGQLVAGGSFSGGLARFDGTWTVLGGGVDGQLVSEVRALALATNDDLLLGGTFDTVDAEGAAMEAGHIGRFDGAAWDVLADGLSESAPELGLTSFPGVNALIEGPQGLVVGGLFAAAGEVGASNLALYDSGVWTSSLSERGMASRGR